MPNAFRLPSRRSFASSTLARVLSEAAANGLCGFAVIAYPVYTFPSVPLVRLDVLTVPPEPTWLCPATLSSEGEGVFAGDPPAGSEATEGGVEHPLPRSEQGGSLEQVWVSGRRLCEMPQAAVRQMPRPPSY